MYIVSAFGGQKLQFWANFDILGAPVSTPFYRWGPNLVSLSNTSQMILFSFRKTVHRCTVCVTQFNWVKMWFSCFPVLTGSAEAQVIWGGIVKRLLIAYFIGNISAKTYQNPFTCIKIIASQRWDVFETRCITQYAYEVCTTATSAERCSTLGRPTGNMLLSFECISPLNYIMHSLFDKKWAYMTDRNSLVYWQTLRSVSVSWRWKPLYFACDVFKNKFPHHFLFKAFF